MKNARKIFAAFIAVLTLLVCVLPASAATNENKLIDTSKKVSLTLNCNKAGYTFSVYKVATLGSNASATKYTSTNAAYGIDEALNKGNNAALLTKLDAVSLSALTPNAVDTFVSSAATTSKKLTGLAQGVYYVRVTKYPAGTTQVRNSVIALPYYNEATASWIYGGSINLATKVKDETPSITKKIENSTKQNVNYSDVSLGDTVTYSITSGVAGSASVQLTKYVVNATMSQGLTLDTNSFSVKTVNANGDTLATLTKGTDYDVNVTSKEEGKETLFNVALSKSYLKNASFYSAANVVVTFNATLNKYAVIGTQGNPNTTDLQYGNSSNTLKIEGNTVYVYTYAITSTKTDEAGNPLVGAEFTAYTTEADTKANTNSIAVGVSDSKGKVVYKNAKGEVMRFASGTYYFVETKAPSGYNLNGQIIKVEVNAEYGSVLNNGTYVTNAPENGTVTFAVEDYKVILPNTGGTGRTIVYVAGSVLLLSAIAVFAVRAFQKRKTAK